MEEEEKNITGQKARLEKIKKWQKRLEKDYRPLIDKRVEALKYRDSDPAIVAVLENRSKLTTTDMQDAIDMAKPDILETIAGIDEPLKLDPSEAMYVESVKKLQALGNDMVKKKNKWFRICSDFLDDSMVFQFGCIKYQWISEEKTTEKEYEGLEDVEIQAFIADGWELVEDKAANEPDEVIPTSRLGTEPFTRGRKTILKKLTTDEYVRYDVVPSERIRFTLDTKDFADTPIVVEEIRLYEHAFIKAYGKENFKKVKNAKEQLEKPDKDFENRFKHVGGIQHVFDEKSGKYKAYECYFWNEDIPWVMTYAALDVVMLDEKNKYGKPPYRGGSPFLIAHSLIGKGYYDLIKSIMEERTFLKRQFADIIIQNNYRRFFINIEACGMNIEDYENNTAMNALIRCTGSVGNDNIRPEQKIELGQDSLRYWELCNVEKDGHIPTPRTYGGLQGGANEKTYRGQQLKVNQAAKKLLMMMRAYMEEVFGPLFQDTLDCIAKFMKKKTVVRYLNEDYDISPEDIVCKYALIVNVGLGSHDKQDLVVKLQQLIGLAMQETETGIVTPQNLYYMTSELVKAMGFLNTMDFVTDPKLKETVMKLIQMIAMFMTHMSELHIQDPEMLQAMQAMQGMIQQVMQALGVKQEPQKGGQNTRGTQVGEKPAALPMNPGNPFNPQQTISGNGFVA